MMSSPWWARLAGLAAVPAPPHVFALDAGRLRYARFPREGARMRFPESHSVELEADAFQSGPLGGPLRDPELLRSRLALLSERLSAPIREASLVLPDAWLRVGFADAGELPRTGEARQDVLRFKLRRLVPYRVEELRIEASEVDPLAGQSADEPRRYVLGFGSEALFSQIESVFAERGIHLGLLTNSSLSLLSALRRARARPGGRPAHGPGRRLRAGLLAARPPAAASLQDLGWMLPEAARGEIVTRDLRLTRSFFEASLPGQPISRLVLSAAEGEGRWSDWVADGLGVRAEPIGREHLPQLEGEVPPSWRDAAPLVGAAGLEIQSTLNLARRPFANLRPLRRLGIALWAVGGLAVLTAGWLFVSYLIGSSEKRAALDRLEDQRAQESQRLSGLRAQLARFELATQNREVGYLNERIAERTFAWSRLFDDLAEVLPWNVRIVSLSPLSITPARRDTRGQRSSEPGEEFALRLVGGARDGEALLIFVDRLFAHPAFGHPNLENERRADAEVHFALTVTYRPRREGAPPAVTASSVTELSGSSPQQAASQASPPGAPAAVAGTAAPGGGGAQIAETSAAPQVGAGAAEPAPRSSAEAAWMAAGAPPAAPPPLIVEPGGWSEVVTGGLTTAAPPQPEPVPLANPYSSTVGISLMTSQFAVWQENWRNWAAPLALAVVGGLALVVYQVRYAGRVEALDRELAAAQASLDMLAAERGELEQAVTRAEANRELLRDLYAGRLGPERDRLTRMIAEVKQLASRAGMSPDAISYPLEEIKDYGLLKKSVVFSVGGTYEGLRQMINFLELSSSFLVLEGVSLGEPGMDGSLGIRLQISTLFVDDRPRPEKSRAPRAARPAPSQPPTTPRAATGEGP